VDSRSASIGSTRVARRAGTSAATTVTPTPTTIEIQTWLASICNVVNGSARPTASMQPHQPLRDHDAEPETSRRGL
jgi:hypothetical protein